VKPLNALYKLSLNLAAEIQYIDLGVLFDGRLKFHNHTTEITAKANRMLGMIKRSFEYLDSSMVTKLFTALVRPTLW